MLTIFGSKDVYMGIMIMSRDNMLVYVLAALDWPVGTVRERALIGRIDFGNDISSSINNKGNRSRVLLVSMIAKSSCAMEDLRAVLKDTDKRGHMSELRMN